MPSPRTKRQEKTPPGVASAYQPQDPGQKGRQVPARIDHALHFDSVQGYKGLLVPPPHLSPTEQRPRSSSSHGRLVIKTPVRISKQTIYLKAKLKSPRLLEPENVRRSVQQRLQEKSSGFASVSCWAGPAPRLAGLPLLRRTRGRASSRRATTICAGARPRTARRRPARRA